MSSKYLFSTKNHCFLKFQLGLWLKKGIILKALKKCFLLSLRSSEGAVAISAFMILRSPRRFVFAKLLVMTSKFKVFQQSQFKY